VFKKFYLSNHNGRRLTWQTNMGTADLKAFFGSRKHELNVSTYQMVILLLFNTSSQITFKELKETSGMRILKPPAFHHHRTIEIHSLSPPPPLLQASRSRS
jgi:hypothetical protein